MCKDCLAILGSASQNACRFAASTIAKQSLTDSALNDSRALTGRSESLANDAGAKRMRSGPLGVARNERERCLEQAAVCGRSQMKCD